MEKLRAYLNGLSQIERERFCAQLGTTLGYLRKAISIKQKLGEWMCINIEAATGGLVTCEELRPDVNWAVLRRPHQAMLEAA